MKDSRKRSRHLHPEPGHPVRRTRDPERRHPGHIPRGDLRHSGRQRLRKVDAIAAYLRPRVKPTSGEIWIKGQNITQLGEEQFNEIRKKMGMAFQNSALFNSMSVGENVALPLQEHTQLEHSTIQIMTRIKLEQVGLSGI